MPYCIAAMSTGKVIAPLLSKAELSIQGWDLLFMGSAGLTLLGFVLFLCLYRPPEPEETPLLPEHRHASSVEETLAGSVEQVKRLTHVSGFQQRSQEEHEEHS